MPVSDNPKEVCVCGDFREQHKNGTGACMLNKPFDVCHGMKDCLSFRPMSDSIVGQL